MAAMQRIRRRWAKPLMLRESIDLVLSASEVFLIRPTRPGTVPLAGQARGAIICSHEGDDEPGGHLLSPNQDAAKEAIRGTPLGEGIRDLPWVSTRGDVQSVRRQHL